MYSTKFSDQTLTWEISVTDQHSIQCQNLIPLEAAPWGRHEPTKDEALTYIERIAWRGVKGANVMAPVHSGKTLLAECDVCDKHELDCECERCSYCDRAVPDSENSREIMRQRCENCGLCHACCMERSCIPFEH